MVDVLLQYFEKFVRFCNQIQTNFNYFVKTFNNCSRNLAYYTDRVTFRVNLTRAQKFFIQALLITLLPNRECHLPHLNMFCSNIFI